MNTTTIKSRLKNIIENGLPVSFTFSEVVYTGTKTVLSKDITYSEFGLSSGYKFSIIAALSDFAGTPPEADSLVTYGGTKYRVITTDTDAADAAIMLNLAQEWS